MACDMPEPCECPSLDSCQNSFLWTDKAVDLAPHPVVCLVLRVEDTENFLMHLISKTWNPFLFRVSKQEPCFTAVEEDGGDKKLVELELACKADDVLPPDPV